MRLLALIFLSHLRTKILLNRSGWRLNTVSDLLPPLGMRIKIMKSLLELATGLIFFTGVRVASGSLVRADQTRTVGVVAVNYSGTTITSLSSAIAVGKTSAAGTASINGSETSASAVAGAGRLTVTNSNSTGVTYQMDAESAADLGITPTTTPVSQSIRIDNLDGATSRVVTLIP